MFTPTAEVHATTLLSEPQASVMRDREEECADMSGGWGEAIRVNGATGLRGEGLVP